ncbi:SWIB/MDM2 domain [Musa troglodytarum]|uniref:SWIB/MDM2 domain n=1 Tax=Musa troglodytarum TaxID=320322 RepID=A0A9E7JUI5_9LILI|nr:SWIB/MDM2 domain [Musa troglodytarum]
MSSSASLRSISFPRSLGSDAAGSCLGLVARSIQLEVERGRYVVEAFRDLEAMVVGQQARKAMLGECPKKVARLIDLVNLPSNLREFAGGQSQMGHLSFFIRVWSHIKTHNLQVSSTTSFPSPLDNVSFTALFNLQECSATLGKCSFFLNYMAFSCSSLEHSISDPNNKNLVNCDDKLKSILLGKTQVELSKLPMLINLHFPKPPK